MGIRPQLTESAVTDVQVGSAGLSGFGGKALKPGAAADTKTLRRTADDACIGREGEGKIGKRGRLRKPPVSEGFNDR
jgi:hypothetical protein